jgi:hypothetical protein
MTAVASCYCFRVPRQSIVELMCWFVALNRIWLTSLLCAPVTLAASCRDIAKVDFRNRVILAPSYTGKPFYGLFNGPGPGGPLRLRNGMFLKWDGPAEMTRPSAEQRDENLRKPDWKTTIEQDVLLNPAGSSGVRVLTLHQNHLTGTGAFTYVFAFACRSGSLSKIFEASGEGLQLERATANSIEVSVGIWADADSHASPSRVEHLRYRWSPVLKRFIRESSNAACPWLP